MFSPAPGKAPGMPSFNVPKETLARNDKHEERNVFLSEKAS
jgi:hypothetical protein